nr:MAG TPA: DNA-packaging protein [Bacteriophage sp.]
MVRTTEELLKNFEEETHSLLLTFCEKYKFESPMDMKQNTFEAAMSYAGDQIFLKSDDVTLKYNRQTIIDTDNAPLIEYILDRYEQICTIYNKEVTLQGFSKYTKIGRQTMYNWLNGECKTKIYIDTDGNVIHDIQEWKLNNRGEYREIASTAHLDIMKKIKEMDEHSLANISIGDRNNTGAAMKLNTKFGWNAPNGRSAEDNNKPHQTAQQIADRHKAALELPEMEKPEL